MASRTRDRRKHVGQAAPVRWRRLVRLFAADRNAALAYDLTLAPQRLERRQMLDAGAAGLLTELVDDADYVQAGADYAGLSTGDGEPQAVTPNTAPTNVQIAPIAAIDENGVATLSLTFDDPDAGDAHSVEVDWGDGTPIQVFSVAADARAFTATHTYADDAPTGTASNDFTIGVRVIDANADEAAAQTTVTVNNVSPSNVVLSPFTGIDENGTVTLDVTFDDPGTLDEHTVAIDWGDGSGILFYAVSAGQRTFSTTHQYADDNPTGTGEDNYVVSVRVLDDDLGASTLVVQSVQVRNVAPSDVVVQPFAAIDEHGVATLNLSFVDPGVDDVHTVAVNWGDGSGFQFYNVTPGARTFTTTHQYLDDNPTGTASDTYIVTVRVLDDDQGASTLVVQPIVVNNVAPSGVVIAPIPAINENGVATLNMSFVDPGSQDQHTVAINWGDGTGFQFYTVTAGARTFSATHQYLDDNPTGTSSDTYVVTVRVLDDDLGASTLAIQTVVVNNVPPTGVVVVPSELAFNEGSLATVTIAFNEPGIQDTHSYSINWGDGIVTTGTATRPVFIAGHTYADNGNYTVTVTITDDDGGQGVGTGTILVLNVDPTLKIVGTPTVNEGQAFTLQSLGVRLQDPGFDNPLNVGGELEETFTGFDVNWGDGTGTELLTVVNRVSGSPGVPTTAEFSHAAHTYADNGVYTVTIHVKDDDGVVVTRTFQIVVNNVAPTLTLTGQQFTISEGQTLSIPNLGTFSDPGFNNPDNTQDPSNGGETAETFTYTIDWGDGTIETRTVPAMNGKAGVPTTGAFGDSHFYADNDSDGVRDNKYTITVTLMDDDGGVDVRTIQITVLNTNPVLNPIAATDVNIRGVTTLQLSFFDQGADSFQVLVDWGDKLHLPPDQRFVVETVHAGPTPKAFTLTHRYAGPPQPNNPAADITIRVKILDDDFGSGVVASGESNTRSVDIANPGINQKLIRIDTSPKVPILTFPVRPTNNVVLVGNQVSSDTDAGEEVTGSAGEARVTGERYLELVVINPDLSLGRSYRLPPEVLSNLTDFVRNLPDGHYAIYLVQAETEVRRLVIEVYVRDGQLIDPGDDTEGGRDRPPTDDAADAADGVTPDEDAAIREAIEAADGPTDGSETAPIEGGVEFGPGDDRSRLEGAGRSAASLRHGATLANVALVLSAAGRKTWQTHVKQSEAKSRRARRRRLAAVGHWRGKRKPG